VAIRADRTERTQSRQRPRRPDPLDRGDEPRQEQLLDVLARHRADVQCADEP
jgi:hypothetical protein